MQNHVCLWDVAYVAYITGSFRLLGSGFILRCDVFVDSINYIEVATTTRELLLGESPEVFDVYAYDKEGECLFSMFVFLHFFWCCKDIVWTQHSVLTRWGLLTPATFNKHNFS